MKKAVYFIRKPLFLAFITIIISIPGRVFAYYAGTADVSKYNVRDFNALGDGVTDDIAAINRCIDTAVAHGGGIVYFPTTNAAYVVSAPIILPSNIVLLGDNKRGLTQSRIKPSAGYNGHLIRSKNYGDSLIQYSGIVGLYLDGSTTTWTAISLYAHSSTIEDCTIRFCYTYGIELKGVNGSNLGLNNTITNNFLQGLDNVKFYNAIMVDYYTADIEISGNYIERCTEAAIKLRSYNNRVINNHIFYVGTHIQLDETQENIITSNYLEYADNASIKIASGSNINYTVDAIISENIFRNINMSQSTSVNGVVEVNGYNTEGFIVKNNRLRKDNNVTAGAIPYFVYVSDTSRKEHSVFDNVWQGSLIAQYETNIRTPFSVNRSLGYVGVGVNNPTTKFAVNGDIAAKKLKVSQLGWPDYVFEAGYKLKPLHEVESFIKTNKHLPGVPSAKAVEEKGLDVGDGQAALLKKVEELTLYIIQLRKDVNQQKVINKKHSLLIRKARK